MSKKEVFLPLSKNRRTRVDMMIGDVMGERNVAELYMMSQFKGVQGILAVADVTRRETLDSIDDWTSSVRRVTGNVPVHILAYKMDLEDQFDSDRQDLKNTVDVSESVEVRISGKWDNGIEFEARYCISVIYPGKG